MCYQSEHNNIFSETWAGLDRIVITHLSSLRHLIGGMVYPGNNMGSYEPFCKSRAQRTPFSNHLLSKNVVSNLLDANLNQ